MLSASPSPDVVVIGAGIVGAACSYYLARAGMRVQVVERGFPCSGASGACEGNLVLWDKAPGAELALGKLAFECWDEVQRTLDFDFEFDRKGSIMVCANERDLEEARRTVAWLSGEGVRCRLLTPEELFEEEPALARDLPGGALFPDDAQVEPRLATVALLEAARRLGATLETEVEAQGLACSPDGRVQALRTSRGAIPTGAVVIAAGAWSSEVGRRFGVEIPIRARKGHLIVGEKSPGFIRRKLVETGYGDTVESSDAGLQVAMVAEIAKSGTVLIGSSRQITGYDTRVDPFVIQAIARRAARFLPALRQMKAVRSYAGLRPFSPDHLPLIGPVGPEGLFVASGHEGAGICESTATGLLISQWITGQPLALPGEWFDPRRFARGPGAELRVPGPAS